MTVESRARPLLFHPAIVLLFSLTTAILYGLHLLGPSGIDSTALTFSGSFFYVVPILVPFVSFLFDRAEHWRKASIVRVVVDALIVGLAIGRVIAHVPFVSGHTLFLSYAILTTRSRLVRVTATMVMLQVIYLKYFVWHDLITSTTGVLIGVLGALLVNRVESNRQEVRNG